MMADPKTRQWLFAEAANYTSREEFISDLALSSIWGDAEDSMIPPERLGLLGMIYDASHATIRDLLSAYHLSQSDFARYFNIPLRTVQDWCGGKRTCPPYVLSMAAEILANNK